MTDTTPAGTTPAGTTRAGTAGTAGTTQAGTSGTPDDTRKVLNRLRRAQGQLTAVIAAVEAGSDCRTVVTQLAAVSSALDRAGFTIVSHAMRECLSEEPGEDNLTVEELEKLFLTLA